ncbi:MAG TPA: gephyrin-like molybdotransferase Glp [Bryobacteraceae bacterium]|nr:gephyrin-like molybdotransferase Glp [Bryobacteraceae bacterium]
MDALDFAAARQCVLDTIGRPLPVAEIIPLADAAGRVLAVDIFADRDYPPSDRSIRDGFAVRSADLPGALRLTGEIRAGQSGAGIALGPGECVRIMTGAPLPAGADAVVMVEHAAVADGRMTTDRTPRPGEFINAAGCEARRGDPVLSAGVRLHYPQIAMLATVGAAQVPVFQRPRVAILATGDEIVPIEKSPQPFEVRNSNSWALAAQAAAAGAVPTILPVAPDRLDATIAHIEQGLAADLLLLSGGVSAGEYDFVETALAHFGAEFFFTRVNMRPGAPLVFGRARGRYFFGLPGNPLSTAVTFAVFARTAIELLSGVKDPRLPIVHAKLDGAIQEKPGLTRFLPARLDNGTGAVAPIVWKGSSDVPSLARSNAYIIAAADRAIYEEGESVPVLLQ